MYISTTDQVSFSASPQSDDSPAELENVAALLRQPQGKFHDPQPFMDALDADLPKQKSRITRLMNDMRKATTLEDKLDKLKQVGSAEQALRRMRLSIFDAQDAVCECLQSGSAAAFEIHESLFPKAADLLKATLNKASKQ